MEPRLSIDANVLNPIFKWTKLANGSLSTLAMRCLTPLSPHCIGEPMLNFVGSVLLADNIFLLGFEVWTRMCRFLLLAVILLNLGAEFVAKMLPVWFQVVGCGSRGQVKMAIRCVALHSSSSSRDENLSQVFKVRALKSLLLYYFLCAVSYGDFPFKTLII